MWLRRRGPSFSSFSLRVRRRVDRILRQSRENRKRGIVRSRDPGTQNPPWYTRDPVQLRKERQERRTRNQVELVSRSKSPSDVTRALVSARKAGVIDERNLRDLVVGKCSEIGCLERCQPMLESWLRRNTFSWTVVLSANARSGHFGRALRVFEEMALEGVKLSSFALCAVVEACERTGSVEMLKTVHEYVERGEFSVKERFWDELIAAYGKIGCADYARRVLERMEQKRLENWNAVVAAYARSGDALHALEVFRTMDVEGVCPSRETFYHLFCAFQCRIQFLEAGRNVYRECCNSGFKSDTRIICAAIKMFSSCGSLRDARMVFERGPCMDSRCCTVMIIEYVAHGVYGAALNLFKRLLTNAENGSNEIDPSAFAAAIDACSATEDFSQGRRIHEQFLDKDRIMLDEVAKTALVTMYGNCGDAVKAAEIFRAGVPSIENKSCWNALMGAYARAGQVRPVLELLRRMDWYGMCPDEGTMFNVLVALRQSGLVKKCRDYFRSIAGDRGLEQTAEHYECVIDMLVRKGFVKQAKELMVSMPYEPRPVMWKLFPEAEAAA